MHLVQEQAIPLNCIEASFSAAIPVYCIGLSFKLS